MERSMLREFVRKEPWKKYVPFFLVTSLFVIPISPTLKSIFVVSSAIGILLTPSYRKELPFVSSEPWCKAAIAFYLVVLVACLWSPADDHIRFVFVEKYSKLLFLPIFAIGFRSRNIRTIGIHAFLLAMIFTCVIALFKHHDDPGDIFHNHIVTGFMIAFAAYLSGLQAFRQVGAKRVMFSLLTLLFSYQVLFLNAGRMGYVVYFVLMLMLLVQNLALKHIAAGILCFCTLFILFSYQSTVLSNRVHTAIVDWNQYQQGEKDTPVGKRFMFHQYAKSLFLSSPWKGHGTGGFAHAFRQDNTKPVWKNILDPHSQYWLVATDSGLLGLAALFGFFTSLLIAALRMSEMKPVMLGMLVAFFLNNVSDSLLLYSAVGYLFIVFSALCLGELVEGAETSTEAIRIGQKKGNAACPAPMHR